MQKTTLMEEVEKEEEEEEEVEEGDIFTPQKTQQDEVDITVRKEIATKETMLKTLQGKDAMDLWKEDLVAKV